MIEATANPTTATTSAQQKSAAPSSDVSGLTSDFETFLKMLTAQARYQDPLEPIDSTEFSAQLAQFSMVEQQVLTNDNLSALLSGRSGDKMSAMANWVGMEARAVTPMQFDGQPISLASNPDRTADQAYLVVSDPAGNEVQRLNIPKTAEVMDWAGVDENGSPLPHGVYNFSVESYSNGEIIQTKPAEVYARIAEAQLQNGDIVLILEGGQAISSSSVTALREPG
ncbi:flagellar hook assembly protein FlgD [Rhodobacteraceae bacterium F11138]|nr:flagellar hook assembly protein FlgD [Rhodobacteraceae bacterium F11138]